MNPEQIISQIPGWANAKDIETKPIGGLTNSNYLVTVQGEKYVLRVSGKNTSYLGINRQNELEALQVAAQHGLGPEVIHFILPEGHLVTRFIEGHHWTYETYCRPENIRRMVSSVKAIHNLPPIQADGSPFHRIESYLTHTNTFEVPYPEGFETGIREMHRIEDRQKTDSFPTTGFCHNDLFGLNYIDDGQLRFIDWEFAGMGDIFFDLATLAYSFDSVGEIPSGLQEIILESYFGTVNDEIRTRYREMKFMVLLYSVMWGLLQHGLQRRGLAPVTEGFDCLEYAHYMFNTIRDGLKNKLNTG